MTTSSDQSGWSRVKAVFNEVAPLATRERPARLDELCGGDRALRLEVESLLAAAENESPETIGPTLGGAESAIGGERAGDRIGPYKLLQLIGEGGFGTVFMAEQEEPVRRRVALKIIKLGMDTRQVVARFEQERQALALMEHPNIARVLDAGATATGRPYFVMELVRGDPVTVYCRRENVPIGGRLALFADICRAVQHAHSKGIIHRDLKPTNVLVTVSDGKPIAKIIDFGIAKATASVLTQKTLFTEHRALIGTPEYMSPEQADPSAMDVDTRSDVYGLGVLLYELLTGATPFDPKRLRSAAFAELQRIIREEEPPRPSTRVSTIVRDHGDGGGIAANTAGQAAAQAGVLKGDLDWIVMKAIEKDRSRRYDTASALADDVERHLRGEAVLAVPASAWYRFSKFARRRRGPLLAGAGVAAALLIGLAGTTYGLFSAREQRDEAIKARIALRSERDSAVAARQEASLQGKAAQQEAKRFKAATDFLGELLSSAGPSGQTGKALTLKEMLDDGAVAIENGSLKDQPEVEATVRMAMGRSYLVLGERDKAERFLRRAMEIWESIGGHRSVGVAECLHFLARARSNASDLVAAEALARESVEVFRAVDPGQPDFYSALQTLGMVVNSQQRPEEARKLLLESIEVAVRINGEESAEASDARAFAAGILHDQAESVELGRRAVEGYRRSYGPKHPAVATMLRNLGGTLHMQRNFDEAERCYQEAFALDTELFGAFHFRTAQDSFMLAWLADSRGDGALAVKRWERSVEINRAVNGPLGRPTSVTINRLANAVMRTGEADRAIGLYRESLAIYEDAGYAHDAGWAVVVNNLIELLSAKAQWPEVLTLSGNVLELDQATLPAENAGRGLAESYRGLALSATGEFAAGEPLALHGFAVLEKATMPSRNEIVLGAAIRVWRLYAKWDAAEPTAERHEQALKWRAKVDELKTKIDYSKPGNAKLRDV